MTEREFNAATSADAVEKGRDVLHARRPPRPARGRNGSPPTPRLPRSVTPISVVTTLRTDGRTRQGAAQAMSITLDDPGPRQRGLMATEESWI